MFVGNSSKPIKWASPSHSESRFAHALSGFDFTALEDAPLRHAQRSPHFYDLKLMGFFEEEQVIMWAGSRLIELPFLKLFKEPVGRRVWRRN